MSGCCAAGCGVRGGEATWGAVIAVEAHVGATGLYDAAFTGEPEVAREVVGT